MTREDLQKIKLPLSSTDYERLREKARCKPDEQFWIDMSPELRKEYDKRINQELSEKYLTSIND
jgi:hypothetical protein